MREIYTKHTFLKKIVATAVVCLFLFEQIAFAAPQPKEEASRHTLSPTSRLKPLVEVDDIDGNITVKTNTASAGLRDLGLTFKQDAEFMYLSLLVGQIVARFNDRISAEGLRRMIEQHLPDLAKSPRFDIENLFKDEETFCVPFLNTITNNKVILRYYAGESSFAGSFGEMSIPLEEGEAYLLCEKEIENTQNITRRITIKKKAPESVVDKVEGKEVVRPLDNIPQDEIKSIFVYGYAATDLHITPKLGETVLNLYPAITGLFWKYPDATIYVAAPYSDIYEAKMFEGRIKPIPQDVVQTANQRRDLIETFDVDMVFDINVVPHNFDHLQVRTESNRPYVVGMPATTGFGSANSPGFLGRPREPVFRDKEGETFGIGGLDEALEEFSDLDPMNPIPMKFKEAGLWKLSIEYCKMLGLPVDERTLMAIDLQLPEAVGAIEWLKKQYYSSFPGAKDKEFDPEKKIVVVNVYSITQEKLMAAEDWIDLIAGLMSRIDDAYFVFTHGGIMDRDYRYVEEINQGVLNRLEGDVKSDALILPKVDVIYPHINNLLGVASATVTLDTGFSHLASGVYDVPSLILTHDGILHWMPTRKNAAKIVLPNASFAGLLGFGGLEGSPFSGRPVDVDVIKRRSLEAGIEGFAELVNSRQDRYSVRAAKYVATSGRERSRLDKELLQYPLDYPKAVAGVTEYLRKCQVALGLGGLPIVPVIAFVDSEEQLGIGIPRFKVKLYTPRGQDTVLMVDKSTLERDGDGGYRVQESIKRFPLIHEAFGHMLARWIFPELAKVSEISRNEGDTKEVLVLKTIEEVLALILTNMVITRLYEGGQTDLVGEQEHEKALMLDVRRQPMGILQYVQRVLKEIMEHDDDIVYHRHSRAIGLYGREIAKRIMKDYFPTLTPIFRKGGVNFEELKARRDTSPAIAFARTDGDWFQFAIDADQHRIINLACKEQWESAEELSDEDPVRQDITDELGILTDIYPVHIKVLSANQLLDDIEYISRDKGVFFPYSGKYKTLGKNFRLVTHPGAYRTLEGDTRSLNVFIPDEELAIIRIMRERDPDAYREWLDHEIRHIKDHIASRVGEEPAEDAVTLAAPIDRFNKIYNQIFAERNMDDQAPAIALQRDNGLWRHIGITADQHKIINLAWKELWQDRKHALDMDHVIVQDLINTMGSFQGEMPFNVHSPPPEEFYEVLYRIALEEGVYFPDAEEFRLVSHPGTYRTESLPRSINLLIPSDELEVLLKMREENRPAYNDWLAHEVGHLFDRYFHARGAEKTEAHITLQNPLTEFMLDINDGFKGPRYIEKKEDIRDPRRPRDMYLLVEDLSSVNVSTRKEAAAIIARSADSLWYEREPGLLRITIGALITALEDKDEDLNVQAAEALVSLSKVHAFTSSEEQELIGFIAAARKTKRFAAMQKMITEGVKLSAHFKGDCLFSMLEMLKTTKDSWAQKELIRAIGKFDHFAENVAGTHRKNAKEMLTAIMLRGKSFRSRDGSKPYIENTYGAMARIESARALVDMFSSSAAHRIERMSVGDKNGKAEYSETKEEYDYLLDKLVALVFAHETNQFTGKAALRLAGIDAIFDLSKALWEYSEKMVKIGAFVGEEEKKGFSAKIISGAKEGMLGNLIALVSGRGTEEGRLAETSEDSLLVRRKVLKIIAENMLPGMPTMGLIPRLFDEDYETPDSVVGYAVDAIMKSADREAVDNLVQQASGDGAHAAMMKMMLTETGHGGVLADSKGKGVRKGFRQETEPPAIALIKDGGKWTQAQMTPAMHWAINAAIETVWEQSADLSREHGIYKDVADFLEEGTGRFPLYIKTMPKDLFYDALYEHAEAENIPMPPKGSFRILTHPGAYRDDENEPRSLNLFLPEDSMEFVQHLRRIDPEQYVQWLLHEAGHVFSRMRADVGFEVPEEEITEEYPLDELISEFNNYNGIDQGDVRVSSGKGKEILDLVSKIEEVETFQQARNLDKLKTTLEEGVFDDEEQYYLSVGAYRLAQRLDDMEIARRRVALQALRMIAKVTYIPDAEPYILNVIEMVDTDRTQVELIVKFLDDGVKVTPEFIVECTELMLSRLIESLEEGNRNDEKILLMRAVCTSRLAESPQLNEFLVMRHKVLRILVSPNEDDLDEIALMKRAAPVVRIEAIKQLAILFKNTSRSIEKLVEIGEESQDKLEDVYDAMATLYIQLGAVLDKRDFRYASSYKVRLAAVKEAEELVEYYRRYINKLEEDKSLTDRYERARKRTEETPEKALVEDLMDLVRPATLGEEDTETLDPTEKNIKVRLEMLRVIEKFAFPGVITDAKAILTILFDDFDDVETSPGMDKEALRRAKNRLLSGAIQVILASDDEEAINTLDKIARNDRTGSIGDRIRLEQTVSITRSIEGGGEADAETPAVALVKMEGKWQQVPLGKKQHEVINKAWGEIWNEGYELPETHELYQEVFRKMGENSQRLPVHIHSPPEDRFYDVLYKIAAEEGVPMFPRAQFRLVAHPGTYRKDTGKPSPRSINLLIPAEELDFLMKLKRDNPDAYNEWIFHEVAHLTDRIYKKKGEEMKEYDVTEEYPLFSFVEQYNNHYRTTQKVRGKAELPEKGVELYRLIIALYGEDKLAKHRAASNLTELIEKERFEKEEEVFLQAAAPGLAKAMKDFSPSARGQMLDALLILARRGLIGEEVEEEVLALINKEDTGLMSLEKIAAFCSEDIGLGTDFIDKAVYRFLERLKVAPYAQEQVFLIETLAALYARANVYSDRIYETILKISEWGELEYPEHTALHIYKRIVPIALIARMEAIARLPGLVRINAERAASDIKEDPSIFKSSEFISKQLASAYQRMLDVVKDRDNANAGDARIRIAAAEALNKLIDIRARFFMALHKVKGLTDREVGKLTAKAEMTRTILVKDAEKLILGTEPAEPSLRVRVELARGMAKNVRSGMNWDDSLRLIEALFDATSDEEERGYGERYDELRREYQALISQVIIASDDIRAVERLKLIAEGKTNDLGEIINKYLTGTATFTLGRNDAFFLDDSRGIEGLPNDEYTAEIKKAIDERNIGTFVWDGEAVVAIPFSHEEGDDIPVKDQEYGTADTTSLTKAITTLSKEDAELLQEVRIVFFEGEREGHYGLARPQIYINAEYLDDKREIERILHHELRERHYILDNMDKMSPGWRKKRKMPTVRGKIKALAAEEHKRLLNEEASLRVSLRKVVGKSGSIGLRPYQYYISKLIAGEEVVIIPYEGTDWGRGFRVLYNGREIKVYNAGTKKWEKGKHSLRSLLKTPEATVDAEEKTKPEAKTKKRKPREARAPRKEETRNIYIGGHTTIRKSVYYVDDMLTGEKVRIVWDDPKDNVSAFDVFYGGQKIGRKEKGKDKITLTKAAAEIREKRRKEKLIEKRRASSNAYDVSALGTFMLEGRKYSVGKLISGEKVHIFWDDVEDLNSGFDIYYDDIKVGDVDGATKALRLTYSWEKHKEESRGKRFRRKQDGLRKVNSNGQASIGGKVYTVGTAAIGEGVRVVWDDVTALDPGFTVYFGDVKIGYRKSGANKISFTPEWNDYRNIRRVKKSRETTLKDDQTRTVNSSGQITVEKINYYVGKTISGEPVSIAWDNRRDVNSGFNVFYGDIKIGHVDGNTYKLTITREWKEYKKSRKRKRHWGKKNGPRKISVGGAITVGTKPYYVGSAMEGKTVDLVWDDVNDPDSGFTLFYGKEKLAYRARGANRLTFDPEWEEKKNNPARRWLKSEGARDIEGLPNEEYTAETKKPIDEKNRGTFFWEEADIQLPGITYDELKELILEVKEDCRDWGVCNLHAEELARRLIQKGIDAKVMKMPDPHYWVEAEGYVIDAFPEGMPRTHIEEAKRLGEERFIFTSTDSHTAKLFYKGEADEVLTEKARMNKYDDVGFYERKEAYASRMLRERKLRLIVDEEGDPDTDEKVKHWEHVAQEARAKLDLYKDAARGRRLRYAKPLPDGSPLAMYGIMQRLDQMARVVHEGWFGAKWYVGLDGTEHGTPEIEWSPETLRRFTVGRMPDGKLSVETVKRDLGTLISLGLVRKHVPQKHPYNLYASYLNGIRYSVADIREEDEAFVMEVLYGLGTRPTAAQKKEAKTKIQERLSTEITLNEKVLNRFRRIDIGTAEDSDEALEWLIDLVDGMSPEAALENMEILFKIAELATKNIMLASGFMGLQDLRLVTALARHLKPSTLVEDEVADFVLLCNLDDTATLDAIEAIQDPKHAFSKKLRSRVERTIVARFDHIKTDEARIRVLNMLSALRITGNVWRTRFIFRLIKSIAVNGKFNANELPYIVDPARESYEPGDIPRVVAVSDDIREEARRILEDISPTWAKKKENAKVREDGTVYSGSPEDMFDLLRRLGGSASVDVLKPRTTNPKTKEPLSSFTIERDLGVLIKIGLVEKENISLTKEPHYIYHAADLSPPEYEEIKPVLASLGKRPTKEVSDAAIEEVAEIRDRYKAVYPFAAEDIGQLREGQHVRFQRTSLETGETLLDREMVVDRVDSHNKKAVFATVWKKQGDTGVRKAISYFDESGTDRLFKDEITVLRPADRKPTPRQYSPARIFWQAYGSPLTIFEILQMFEEAVTAEDVRLETEGRYEDGHLSPETVKRDLGTLVYLGLVHKKGEGNDAEYTPLITNATDIQAITPVLAALGDRPDKFQKQEARDKIEEYFWLEDKSVSGNIREGGTSRIKVLEYRGTTRVLPNGNKLVKGNRYLVKIPQETYENSAGDKIKASPEDIKDTLEHFIIPAGDVYRQLNPSNSNKYLPKMLGTAREVGITSGIDPRTPIVEYIEGRNLKDYVEKKIMLLPVESREQQFLRIADEVLKGYRNTYFDKGYMVGDISESDIVVAMDGPEIKRLAFIDNDSPTRRGARGHLTTRRQALYKRDYISPDRFRRMEQGLKDEYCKPRDDVYAIASMLHKFTRQIYRERKEGERDWKDAHKPGKGITEIRELLDFYADESSSNRADDDVFVKEFLRKARELIAKHVTTPEARVIDVARMGEYSYIEWINRVALTDVRNKHVFPLHVQDTKRVEKLSSLISGDPSRPDITEEQAKLVQESKNGEKEIRTYRAGGDLQGYISLEIEKPDLGEKQAYIDGIAVSPEYRGTGIASMMLANVIDEFFYQRVRMFVADVRESDERAKALFENMGFTGMPYPVKPGYLRYALKLDTDGNRVKELPGIRTGGDRRLEDLAMMDLDEVEAVFSDFDGVDRDHSELVSDETVATKRALSARGVKLATITGRNQDDLFKFYGGAQRAGSQAISGEYLALTYSGATANAVDKNGNIVPLEGYENSDLGGRGIVDALVTISRESLMQAAQEAQVPEEEVDKVGFQIREEQVTLFTKDSDAINNIRHRIATLIREKMQDGVFDPNIDVAASAGAVDIMSTSKGRSAIQLIKNLGLKKVVIIGDSVGTEKEPGNDRSLFTITGKDLEAAGVFGYVEIIKVYVGRERDYQLPKDVVIAEVSGKENEAAHRIYEMILAAKDERARRGHFAAYAGEMTEEAYNAWLADVILADQRTSGIRPIMGADVEAVKRLAGRIDSAVRLKEEDDDIERIAADQGIGREDIYVFESGGRPEGFIQFAYSEDGKSVFIQNVAVSEKHEGKGVASLLMAKVMNDAINEGAVSVGASVLNRDKRGSRLLEKFGFQVGDFPAADSQDYTLDFAESGTERETSRITELFVKDGVPVRLLKLLRREAQALTAEEFCKKEKTMLESMGVSADSVEANLDLLAYLGLVYKIDSNYIGGKPGYQVAVTDMRDLDAVLPLVEELKNEPTREEKEEAKRRIADYFFTVTDEFAGGLFKAVKIRYNGATRVLPNGKKLIRGKYYIVKTPKLGPIMPALEGDDLIAAERAREKTRDTIVSTLLEPMPRVYSAISPHGKNEYLPELIANVKDLGLDWRFDPRTSMFEFVNGVKLADFIRGVQGQHAGLREFSVLAREEHFRRMALKLILGYKTTYFKNGYMHGDIDDHGILVVADNGHVKRLVFVDNDSASPQEARSEVDILRKSLRKDGGDGKGQKGTYLDLTSRDRKRRLANKDPQGAKQWCLPKDDVYAICQVLLMLIKDLYGREEHGRRRSSEDEKPGPWMEEFKAKLKKYKGLADNAVVPENLVEYFLEELQGTLMANMKDSIREALAAPETGEHYIPWLRKAALTDKRTEDIDRALPGDAKSIERISERDEYLPVIDGQETLRSAIDMEYGHKIEVYREHGVAEAYISFETEDTNTGPPQVAIHGIGVAKDYRKKGVATILLANVIYREFVDHKAQMFRAVLDPDDERSRRLFEGMGFDPVEKMESTGQMIYMLLLDRAGKKTDAGRAWIPKTHIEGFDKIFIREKTRKFMTEVQVRAFNAAQAGQKVMIGLDTSWIPEMQSDLQALLNELSRLSKQKGLDNILIVRGHGTALAQDLERRRKKEKVSYENMIILGSVSVMDADEFDVFRSSDTERRAFIVGINAMKLTDESYINVLDMIRYAIGIESGAIDADTVEGLEAVVAGPRQWTFIPEASPFDFRERSTRYAAERKYITSA